MLIQELYFQADFGFNRYMVECECRRSLTIIQRF